MWGVDIRLRRKSWIQGIENNKILHFLFSSKQKVVLFSSQELVPLTAIAAMPGATMRIYMGEPVDGRVAESVKIGDPLTLVNTFFLLYHGQCPDSGVRGSMSPDARY